MCWRFSLQQAAEYQRFPLYLRQQTTTTTSAIRTYSDNSSVLTVNRLCQLQVAQQVFLIAAYLDSSGTVKLSVIWRAKSESILHVFSSSGLHQYCQKGKEAQNRFSKTHFGSLALRGIQSSHPNRPTFLLILQQSIPISVLTFPNNIYRHICYCLSSVKHWTL